MFLSMTREDNLYQDFLDLKVLYINGTISIGSNKFKGLNRIAKAGYGHLCLKEEGLKKITLNFLFIIKTRIYVIWLIMAGQSNILDN